jgi:mutator protein MutT
MIRVAVALIRREGRWFLQRRDPRNPVLPGLWEFPGGKIQAGETAETALLRELREELNWEPRLVEELEPITYAYPEGLIELHPFRCEGPGAMATELGWGWFESGEIGRLPIPEANRGLLLNPVFRESP